MKIEYFFFAIKYQSYDLRYLHCIYGNIMEHIGPNNKKKNSLNKTKKINNGYTSRYTTVVLMEKEQKNEWASRGIYVCFRICNKNPVFYFFQYASGQRIWKLHVSIFFSFFYFAVCLIFFFIFNTYGVYIVLGGSCIFAKT